MLLALFLDLPWPAQHPLLMLFSGALVSAILTFLAALYWRRHDARKAAHAAELAAAAKTATDAQEWDDWVEWRKHIEAQIAAFVPGTAIDAKNSSLGHEIGENQAKIKAYHDAAESNYNALNVRVIAMEQHIPNLQQLPSQVQKLNTDHAVLAAKVDTLAGNIKELSVEQKSHFNSLMTAVQAIAFTQGQVQGGAPRPIQLPTS